MEREVMTVASNEGNNEWHTRNPMNVLELRSWEKNKKMRRRWRLDNEWDSEGIPCFYSHSPLHDSCCFCCCFVSQSLDIVLMSLFWSCNSFSFRAVTLLLCEESVFLFSCSLSSSLFGLWDRFITCLMIRFLGNHILQRERQRNSLLFLFLLVCFIPNASLFR